MSSAFAVQNRQQLIVPVRFARARSGAPSRTTPDVDDRAWNNPHFTSWTDIGVRGGQLGIMLTEEARLRVRREHLDDSAPIFVTVRRPSGATEQVTVTVPTDGGPLPATGVLTVHGSAPSPTTGAGNILEARLGSRTGPILAECEVRVFTRARVFVTPHVCTIHTTAAAPGDGTRPSIDVAAVMDMVRAIWWHAGVDAIADAAAEDQVFSAPFVDAAEVAGSAAGQADWLTNGRFTTTAPGRINVYFIRHGKQNAMVGNPLGRASHRGNMALRGLTRPGVFVAVDGLVNATNTVTFTRATGAGRTQELANDTAHEIGHFLTLSHFGGVNSPGRDDTYARRNLMHPNNLLPRPVASGAGANNVRLDDVGYGTGAGGAGHRGCLVTLKQHNLFAGAGATSASFQFTAADAQAAIVRMQIFQSPGRPFPGLALY